MKCDCTSPRFALIGVGMKHETFLNAVESWHKAKGMTQKEFAVLAGIAPFHINAIFRGRVNLSENNARKMSEITGVDFKLYWGGEAPDQVGEYVSIPFRAATASMGPGSFENSKKVKAHLAFREDWVYQKGVPSQMSVIRARGSSMNPTIPDGCMVLIDESQVDVINGRIYFVALNDELLLKRVKVLGGKIFLESDENGNSVEVGAHDSFEVIGRALWYGCEL